MSTGAQRGVRIFIVDDDPDTTAMFGKLLACLGYSSQGLTDPALAIQAAKKFNANLIFMDLAMPGMNGFEVIAQLRDDPVTKDIPIVVTSGYVNANYRRRALAAGANEFLGKPILAEQIREVAAKLLYQSPNDKPARGSR